MSFKNIKKNENGKNSDINNFSGRLIDSYMSLSERGNKPKISLALRKDKKIRFGLLSPLKPKLIDMKGLRSENKIKLVNGINSFRKIYFNNYKNQAFSMKEIRNLKKENNLFSKNYKIMKEKNGENKKQYFADIKEEYDKINYYVSPIIGNKKNLFKGNILLSNDKELENFILYNLGTNKSNIKSLSFIEKIQNEIFNRRDLKNEKLKNRRNNFDKITRDIKKEIKKSKSEIKKVKNTINLIDEIDFFFNSNNKQYLNNLKYEDSRESSSKFSNEMKNIITNETLDNLKVEKTNATNNINSTETAKYPKINKNKNYLLVLKNFKKNKIKINKNPNKKI